MADFCLNYKPLLFLAYYHGQYETYFEATEIVKSLKYSVWISANVIGENSFWFLIRYSSVYSLHVSSFKHFGTELPLRAASLSVCSAFRSILCERDLSGFWPH